ncbi:uncharacterized protein JCM15063_002527 [Sporobolomyces koalae]|uniref:uncharacterized protein n=1 Tax=Sporobolomyces koalae TaxID=500713 RepID=UPI003175982C
MLSFLRSISSVEATRTFSTSSTVSARTPRNAAAPHAGHAVPARIPRNAPPNWRQPQYRTVPHLAVTKGSYSYLFQTRTRWITHALAQGQHIPKDLLYKLLDHRSISPGHVALWVEILNEKDPIKALERLGLLESANTADEVQSLASFTGSTRTSAQAQATRAELDARCPVWLYLAIPAMVHTRDQVPYLVSQLLSERFSSLDERHRSFFLERCIQHFLKVRHYVALRETIEFIATLRPQSGGTSEDPDKSISRSSSFARILRALASERIRAGKKTSAPSGFLHSLRDLVLATMRQRQVPRNLLDMWLPLFSTALIPQDPARAIELLLEMKAAGWTPKRVVLHQVLKVVVKHGGIEQDEAATWIHDQLDRNKEHITPSNLSRQLESAKSLDAIPLHLRQPSDLARIERNHNNDAVLMEGPFDEEPESSPDHSGPSPRLDIEKSEPILVASPKLRGKITHTAKARRVRYPRSRDDIYSTTRLLDRSESLAYLAELRTFVYSPLRPASNFPPPPFASSPVAWSAFFQSIVHETSGVNDKLVLKILENLETASQTPAKHTDSTSYVPPRPTLRMYTIVMQALLNRAAYSGLVNLFRRLESGGFALDATVLDLVVRALCMLEQDKEAIRIVRYYQHLPSAHDRSILVSLRSPRSSRNVRPHSVRLDIVPFNSLLSHLAQVGKYRDAWTLFKSLEEKHEVRPDVATLTIMLDAARYASAEAGKGWGSGFDEMGEIQIGSKRQDSKRRRGTSQRVRGSGATDDKWDGVGAAKRMEKFVWDEIVEGNWQGIELDNPLESKRGVATWFSERFTSGSSSSTTFPKSFVDVGMAGRADNNAQPFASTLSPAPPSYPDIFPNDQLLRSLILLTGTHSHIPRIGQILAWARYANVELSRYTLCLALYFIEGDAAIKRDRILNLRTWLSEWIGGDNVPVEDEIAWMRRGGRAVGRPEVK